MMFLKFVSVEVLPIAAPEIDKKTYNRCQNNNNQQSRMKSRQKKQINCKSNDILKQFLQCYKDMLLRFIIVEACLTGSAIELFDFCILGVGIRCGTCLLIDFSSNEKPYPNPAEHHILLCILPQTAQKKHKQCKNADSGKQSDNRTMGFYDLEYRRRNQQLDQILNHQQGSESNTQKYDTFLMGPCLMKHIVQHFAYAVLAFFL